MGRTGRCRTQSGAGSSGVSAESCPKSIREKSEVRVWWTRSLVPGQSLPAQHRGCVSDTQILDLTETQDAFSLDAAHETQRQGLRLDEWG